SLITGRVTKTVARNPHYDVEGIGEAASPLILDPRTRALLGLAYQTDLPRVALSDESLAAAHALIDGMYPGHTHIPTQWSDDRRIVLFRSSGDRAEAVPFLVNVPEGKVRPLSPPEELAGEGRVV